MSDLARVESKASVVGYVEALTGTEALGWAWCPGQSDRLRVELRLGSEVLSQAVADRARDDLARSGIGDGRHAFTLPIPEAVSARSSELRIVAYSREGARIALEPPPAAPAIDRSLAPIQRGIDALVNSQRLLHRNLQTALLQQGPSPASTMADLAAAQAKLAEAVATVELFVVRLETALHARETVATAAPHRRLLLASIAISGVACVGSCWAVYRSVTGG